MSHVCNILASSRAVMQRSGRRAARRRHPSRVIDPSFWRRAQYLDARGLHRVWNDAEYRFYADDTDAPVETDTPVDSNATLPHTYLTPLADADPYRFAASYFNGVLDSGLGDIHEIVIEDGSEYPASPLAPYGVSIERGPDGVCILVAHYDEEGDTRGDHWAIQYTTDGGLATIDDPNVTIDFPATGAVSLRYELPAQSHGTVVHAIVQVGRIVGAVTVYSKDPNQLTLEVDTAGPAAPPAASTWPGTLPKED